MNLSSVFSGIKDHRVNRTKVHPVENILFISLSAIICGAETWNEIERFGNAKKDWLSKHIDLSSGIPSHDTFNRFFSALDPSQFELCFRKWVSSTTEGPAGDIISFDGKTIRGSKGFGRSALHVVSAWSSRNQISLGQIASDAKSNEITLIPELLNDLFIEGSVVTIDAMGCQERIAEAIVSKRADYILAVKANNRYLLNDIEDSFKVLHHHQKLTVESDHGRIEERRTSVISDLSLIDNVAKWANLKSIVRVQAIRTNKTTGEIEESARYYITSLDPVVDRISHAVRSHWSIENNLHWALDVAFHEDSGKKRNENAVLNFSLLNKIALAALKSDKGNKSGDRSKRLIAAWDNEYLETLIN